MLRALGDIKLCPMQDSFAEVGKLFWQFEIAGVPLPHCKTQGKVGGREGEWWIKVWGERLLFCATDAPERVFAVATPYESETGLVAFWHAAVERGDWGEVRLHAQSLTNAEETDTGFVTIYSSDEIAWTREWQGGNWIERRGLSAALVRGWPAQSYDVWDSPFELEEDHLKVISSREFPQAERQNQTLFWLRGSRAQWKQVLQACATVHFASSATREDKRSLTAEGRRFYGFAHSPFFVGWMDGVEDGGGWRLPSAWRELFTRSFVYTGWSWSRRNKQPENLRSGWKVKPSVISANIQLTLHPSQHQQLEARLFLRDWLRDKVSAEQIAKLLE